MVHTHLQTCTACAPLFHTPPTPCGPSVWPRSAQSPGRDVALAGGVRPWWDEQLQVPGITTVCGAPQTLPAPRAALSRTRLSVAALLQPCFGFPAGFSRKCRESQLWEQLGSCRRGACSSFRPSPAAEPQLTTSKSRHPRSHICLKRKKVFLPLVAT